MENKMTTSPHDTKEFWDDVKVDYTARAKDIAALGSDELDALQELRWSCSDLSESVEYFMDFEYLELVKFMKASRALCDDFDWDQSSCEGKSYIAKKSKALSDEITKHDCRLTLMQVREFSVLAGRIHHYFQCEPNKYQMKRFEEFGITWEGEVRDH
jgi:hypothetical protein